MAKHYFRNQKLILSKIFFIMQKLNPYITVKLYSIVNETLRD